MGETIEQFSRGLGGALAAIACSLAVTSVGTTACRRAPSKEAVASGSPRTLASGAIRGHVRLVGIPPEKEVIRMRADPMCDCANGGQRVLQEAVIAGADGSLGNVFVHLQGSFTRCPSAQRCGSGRSEWMCVSPPRGWPPGWTSTPGSKQRSRASQRARNLKQQPRVQRRPADGGYHEHFHAHH